MPKFSEKSLKNLDTCDPDLQRLFNEVIKWFDCSITEGHRNEEKQNLYFKLKKSKVEWPNGKHNTNPSEAVDAPPCPIKWPDKKNRPKEYIKDIAKFYLFAGYVLGTAQQMGIKIRWGGDWDRDFDILDQSFDDLPHFELIK